MRAIVKFVAVLVLLAGMMQPVQADIIPPVYDYKVVSQSPGGSIMQGTGVILWVTIENTGNTNWYGDSYFGDFEGNPIHLGTVRPTDRNSGFYTPENWISTNRIHAADEAKAEPGETMSFGFFATAPETLSPGTYTECFAPVIEGVTWLPDHGICWDITVRENPYQNLDYRAEIGSSDANVFVDAVAGEVIEVNFQARNVGQAIWYQNGAYPVHVATYNPQDRTSNYYHPSWLSTNRPAGLIEEQVRNGEYGHFTFLLQVPFGLADGVYTEDFWLVAENRSWVRPEVKDSATFRFRVEVRVNEGDLVDSYEPMKVPVLSLSYIPLKDGRVDTSVMNYVKNDDLNTLRNAISNREAQLIYSLEQGSRFRAYKDDNAERALDFEVIENIEFNQYWQPSPEFVWPSDGKVMIDFMDILTADVDVCDYVDGQGVKEVWIWGYTAKNEEPKGWEVSMAMGESVRGDWNKNGYGNVSNSWRQNDLPVCQNTYTVYYNKYGRELGTMLENRTHQIESVLNYVDGRDNTPGSQWDDLLFWGNFVGSDSTGTIVKPGCGWTEYPPNGRFNYDWYNFDPVDSDCADWRPDGSGQKLPVSCTTWGGPSCRENGDEGSGTAFKIWWMQSIPGVDNGLSYQGRELKNWWVFIGDFDNQLRDKSLVE